METSILLLINHCCTSHICRLPLPIQRLQHYDTKPCASFQVALPMVGGDTMVNELASFVNSLLKRSHYNHTVSYYGKYSVTSAKGPIRPASINYRL